MRVRSALADGLPVGAHLAGVMDNEHDNLTDRDVLLSRLLDGRGRAADWRSLRDATAADAVVWDKLIGSAGDQDALGDLMLSVGDRAANTDLLPAPGCVDAPPVPLSFSGAQQTSGRRHDRAARSARLGWLVAACLALGMVSLAIKPWTGAENGAGSMSAGLNLDSWTAKDFMDKYKDRASKDGTLVAEMPQRIVLETRPCADGKGHEVLFIRQLIERAVVDDLYKLGVDDAGRPAMVPASLDTPRPAGAM